MLYFRHQSLVDLDLISHFDPQLFSVLFDIWNHIVLVVFTRFLAAFKFLSHTFKSLLQLFNLTQKLVLRRKFQKHFFVFFRKQFYLFVQCLICSSSLDFRVNDLETISVLFVMIKLQRLQFLLQRINLLLIELSLHLQLLVFKSSLLNNLKIFIHNLLWHILSRQRFHWHLVLLVFKRNNIKVLLILFLELEDSLILHFQLVFVL